jgi:glyoxalase family protein
VTVEEAGPTHAFLTDVLGLTCATPTADASRRVYEIGDGGAEGEMHVVEAPDQDRGWLGHGGVHHVALRTPDADALAQWRERIDGADHRVTPVIDRHYFHSIYVREPGGILIEIATDTGHSFPIEEAQAGTLTLPPKLEPRRASIEANLPAVDDA